MKSTLLLTTLAFIVLSISSCNLDNPLGPGDPKNIEPILLEDRYDNDITLTDHNGDGVDYIVADIIEIYGGKMNIEPGVTIEFEDGSGLLVGIEGRLDAVGTSGEPIRMIAKENEPSWSGIYINTTKANKIHHVIIENAGKGESFGVFNEFDAAVTVDGSLSMENSTITKSGEMGLIVNRTDESSIEDFSGNTIKDSENFPIYTNINFLEDLNLAENSFSNNGTNMIAITDRYADRLTRDIELDGLDIPYFLSGEFEIYGNLTLNRGVDFVMDNNTLLDHDAGDDYRFEIKGTESDHVVIRGAESENGYWQGIYITSQNSGNQFEYLDISDGGGKELTFRDGKANIAIDLGGTLTVRDCTSARSGDCEVFLSNFSGTNTFINESPAITKVCEE